VLTAAIRYPPATGGVETHAHEVAKELIRRGHEVRVFTSDLEKEHPFIHFNRSHDIVEGVPVSRKRAYTLGEGLHYPFMPGELAMLRFPADVLHAHSFGYFHTNVLALRRNLRPTPLVITPHYHPPETMQGGPARQAMRRIYDSEVANWVFDQADRIIAVSRAELSSMAHHITDLEKVRIIPNGIDTSRFEEVADPAGFCAPRDIKGPLVLYVGRLAQNKRMELVIEAMPDLLEEAPDLTLVVVGPDDGAGDGWKALAVELGVDSRVRFEGFLSEEDLLSAYSAADLFVLPSDWEAFGIVLLEAMACRTPCVVSDRGGPQEVVQDGGTGLVVPYGDKDAWKGALLELLGDPGRRRQMGEAGRRRALDEFSWSSVVDRVEQVYQEVVAA
jgi:glycosyltransferase involved in cell wall biosynthesis